MESINQWIENDGLAISFIILGAALLYIIGGRLVSSLTKQIVKGKDRSQPKKDIEKRQRTLAALTTSVWNIIVIAVALVSIFKVIFPGIDLSPLFASAGIVGIAIAFGSQALVKDFLSGLFIISENQYRVGDVVKINNNAEGTVERLGTRSTVVRDFDGNVHYIPNGSITHVMNQTMGYSRVNFTLPLSSSTDLNNAIKIINETGAKLAKDPDWSAKIIDPPQFESVVAFTKTSTEVKITGKVQPSDQWRVTAEMRRRLLEALSSASIELA